MITVCSNVSVTVSVCLVDGPFSQYSTDKRRVKKIIQTAAKDMLTLNCANETDKTNYMIVSNACTRLHKRFWSMIYHPTIKSQQNVSITTSTNLISNSNPHYQIRQP